MNRRAFLKTLGVVGAVAALPVPGFVSSLVLDDTAARVQRRILAGETIVGESFELARTVYVRDARGFQLINCYFEALPELGDAPMLDMDLASGGTISGCHFAGNGRSSFMRLDGPWQPLNGKARVV